MVCAPAIPSAISWVAGRMVDGVFLVDGAYAAAGRMVTLSVPKGRCVTVRATTGLGWSSAIYINC